MNGRTHVSCIQEEIMEFCPSCKMMTAEKMVPCYICQRAVCHSPCRTRCSTCRRLVCSEEMTECSNCDKSICHICQVSEHHVWKVRPECCMDRLPPLCGECPETHNQYTCESCGKEDCCEDYTYTCFCDNKFCDACTDVYTNCVGCVFCVKIK